MLSTETRLDLDSLLDARHMSFVLDRQALIDAIFGSLLLLLSFFLLRTMFRRTWLAAAAFIVALPSSFSVPLDSITWVFSTGSQSRYLLALLVFILTRFGVLALIAAFSVSAALGNFPLTADFSTWYAGSSLFAMASVLALTAYALYTALAGRPLFKAGFLDSD